MLWDIIAALALSWARIAVALLLSVSAALILGIYAGISRKVDRVAIPILDVLQSVPILGFFPIAVFFLANAIPLIGYEIASIFLIFTCTFWNIAFAVYEGVRSIPQPVIEIAELSKLSLGGRFSKIFIPASFPRIADQLPASLANAFYFLAASEVMSLGEAEVRVTGIGTLILKFQETGNLQGVAAGIIVTGLSIAAAYLLIITPLISYSNRYRFDFVQPPSPTRAGILTGLYSRVRSLRAPLGSESKRIAEAAHRIFPIQLVNVKYMRSDMKRFILIALIVAFLVLLAPRIFSDIEDVWLAVLSVVGAGLRLGLSSVGEALAFSFMRVLTCLALMLVITLPVALLMTEKPKLKTSLLPFLQMMAAMPSPLIFPLISSLFESGALARELGALFLMSLGSIWYVFYSTLSGFNRVHVEYLELARMYDLSILDKFRYIYLPFATPSLVTGLITASGGAWNTVIVAERLGEGGRIFEVYTPGLGKMMSMLAESADTPGLIFTVIIMTVFVIVLNRLVWRTLYDYSIRALRIHEQF